MNNLEERWNWLLSKRSLKKTKSPITNRKSIKMKMMLEKKNNRTLMPVFKMSLKAIRKAFKSLQRIMWPTITKRRQSL